jgi:hypothetical protein
VPLWILDLTTRSGLIHAKVGVISRITGLLQNIPMTLIEASQSQLFTNSTMLHGFKRGKDAFIPAGKRYEVFVNGQAVVKVK